MKFLDIKQMIALIFFMLQLLLAVLVIYFSQEEKLKDSTININIKTASEQGSKSVVDAVLGAAPQSLKMKCKICCKSMREWKLYKFAPKLKHKSQEVNPFLPLIRQFADVASDVAVSIAFAEKMSDTDTKEADTIDYKWLFIDSLLILILSRIIGSVIIYSQFSRNIIDALLHLFDLYIFKVIWIGAKCGHEQALSVRTWVGSLECIFEASPQLLLSLFVIIASKEKVEVIVVVSSIMSLLSVGYSAAKQDRKYFKHSWKIWKKK